jgi:hypothetical protein
LDPTAARGSRDCDSCELYFIVVVRVRVLTHKFLDFTSFVERA